MVIHPSHVSCLAGHAAIDHVTLFAISSEMEALSNKLIGAYVRIKAYSDACMNVEQSAAKGALFFLFF